MKLAAYLTTRSMSDAEFADKVGVHRSTVGRWCSGVAKPEWAQLTKISEVTDGEVTPNDFVDDEAAPRNEAAA